MEQLDTKTDTRWCVEKVTNGILSEINVYPLGDIIPHSLTRYCACMPEVILGGMNELTIIVHDSFDGRETDEYLPH